MCRDHRLCKRHCFSGDGVQKRGAYPRSGRKAVCYRGTGAGIRHFGKRHLRSHSVLTGGGSVCDKAHRQAHACARNWPYLLGHAAAVGKKEGEGPLGERFDYVAKNDRMGQRSWELAESELQKDCHPALRCARPPCRERSLDLILAGDLLNQCIGSFLASMHANVPYPGSTVHARLWHRVLRSAAVWSRAARQTACLRQHPRILLGGAAVPFFRLPTAVSAHRRPSGQPPRQARQCSAVSRCRTARSRAMCA